MTKPRDAARAAERFFGAPEAGLCLHPSTSKTGAPATPLSSIKNRAAQHRMVGLSQIGLCSHQESNPNAICRTECDASHPPLLPDGALPCLAERRGKAAHSSGELQH